MARRFPRSGYGALQSIVTAAVGDSDAQTKIDLCAPFIGAKVDRVHYTTKTAGVGTGSFTIVLEEVGGTDLASAVTIDADSAADTVHGTGNGNGTAVATEGGRLAVVTVKTGTVSTGVVLIVTIFWSL